MMLGITRQGSRLLRQPGAFILRRCLAAEAAQAGPAMSLTFGSPAEVNSKVGATTQYWATKGQHMQIS